MRPTAPKSSPRIGGKGKTGLSESFVSESFLVRIRVVCPCPSRFRGGGPRGGVPRATVPGPGTGDSGTRQSGRRLEKIRKREWERERERERENQI